MALSKTAQKIYNEIKLEYGISDSGGLLLLQTVAESYDQYKEALKIYEKEGFTIKDRWGQIKVNPATTVMRDSKSAMMQALKALDLDFTAVPSVKLEAKYGKAI